MSEFLVIYELDMSAVFKNNPGDKDGKNTHNYIKDKFLLFGLSPYNNNNAITGKLRIFIGKDPVRCVLAIQELVATHPWAK